MTPRKFRTCSWVDPRVAVRDSDIHGRGAFATSRFRAGETVVIFGGTVFSAEQVAHGEARQNSYSPITPGLYLGTPVKDPAGPADYINHSCDPNIWLTEDDCTWVARCDVDAEQELTADYATFNLPGDTASWQCNCGSPLCRGGWTGQDLARFPELRTRYGSHVMGFLRGLGD